ncbi:MAG: hypothetical protein DRQ03_00490 [Candidatus Hydrothermota bacterium]|nr:MAG: hypothetical protein DRQ03_00490 [Candidatus Hydrothermae bacterium]
MNEHLNRRDILRILDGEKLESAKEKHLFSCKRCFERVLRLLELELGPSESDLYGIFEQILESEIAIKVEFGVQDIYKGEPVYGGSLRGKAVRSPRHANRLGITVKGEKSVIDVRTLKNKTLEVEVLSYSSGVTMEIMDEKGDTLKSFELKGTEKVLLSSDLPSKFWILIK